MKGSGLLAARYLGWLVLAALLEVGGDAGMRAGIHGKRPGFIIGAVALIVYGLVVNAPKWDFGRLLGIYIAVFFVISQLIAAIVFQEKIKAPVLLGGALIVAGGLVLAVWQVK